MMQYFQNIIMRITYIETIKTDQVVSEYRVNPEGAHRVD